MALKLAVKFADVALVAPGGMSWPSFRDGISAVTYLDDGFPVRVGAPCLAAADPPDDWPYRLFPRALGLALAAARALKRDPGRKYGLVLGMPNLNTDTAYVEHVLVHRHQPAEMAHTLGYSYDVPLAYLARFLGVTGPRLRVDSACATGNDALIAAHQWLEAGVVDNVLVIAASAMLNPVGTALFHNLTALNPRRDLAASCPFDRRRSGFVMGEGAAAVWLTRDDNVPAMGYLCGYGQSLNGEKFVDMPSDLTAMAAACRQAFAGFGLPAYISAHGTATSANDRCETRLYHQLFGKDAANIPVSSQKSMIGHTLGAAALIEAIITLAALDAQLAPPTINLQEPDPECDLNYVPLKAQPIRGNFALSNAFAFGGQNSSVLLAKEAP